MPRKVYAEKAAEAGIPESPALRTPREEPPNPLADYHVGGIRVGDLPFEMQSRLVYQQTDEGIAENNAGKSPHRIETVSDEFNKAMQHRRDAVKDLDYNLEDAPNPMKEAMEKHVPKGMRGRFLAPRVIDRRGMRGWEPVLDENGKQIKVRDSILAQMPEERAIARNKKVREHGNNLLGQVRQQYLEEGGKTAVSD